MENLKQRKKIAISASFAVAAILVTVTWLGLPLLDLFGIKIPAFQVAGGFVLAMVALSMLRAEPNRIQPASEESPVISKASIAVVPLAMPIMAGPGAITTVVVGASIWTGILNHIFLSISAIFVAFTTGSVLYFASHFEKVLRQTGVDLITRIGGLILASMSVQSIASGIHGLWLFYQ